MTGGAAASVLYAVIVGWNGSPSPDVPRLRYADDDAAEYARLFRDAGARVTLLTELDGDSRLLHPEARPDGRPTRQALLGALARIDSEMAEGEKKGERGELYFVYSGHGDVDHGEGFVTLDGGRLTRGDLHERVLLGRRAERLHVIVDACKSYFFVYARGGGRRAHPGAFVDERALEALPNAGFLLSSSTDNDSHEWEDFQGGVFSHEVRSGLRGAADADGDGNISYAELGAFVRRANAPVQNPRFRPRFTVAAPAGSPLEQGAPLLRWSPQPADRGARLVVLDVPDFGRISVEDDAGRRLLDAHVAGSATVLHLPSDESLFVWSRPDDHEYALAASAGALRLSSVRRTARRIASRGALHEAFGRLFALAFDSAAVADYLAHPDLADLPEGEPEENGSALSRRIRTAGNLKKGALGLAVGATVTAALCTLAAAVVRADASDAAHDARAAANDRIGALNGAAIGLYAAGGAAALSWAILSLWPKPKSSASPTVRPGFSPGPGAVGLSLAVGFR